MRCDPYLPPSLLFCRTFQGCFQLVPCKPIDPRSFDVAWWVKSPGFVACFLEDISSKSNNPSNNLISLPNFAPLCPPLMCQSCTFFCPFFLLDIFFLWIIGNLQVCTYNITECMERSQELPGGSWVKHLPVVEWSETGWWGSQPPYQAESRGSGIV